jgi:predicted nuclease of predicted toxin-antitoxin system
VARLYLDHNVASSLALLLEVAGHDVVTTRVTGEARATDDALLLSSVRASRVFITHNRKDFRLLHDAWTIWPAVFGIALPPPSGHPRP